MPARGSPRRQQILEALASELQDNPGGRITTARIAAVVGVSEAALYRHFPSKAKMFEDLLEFAESSIFGLVNRIVAESRDPEQQIEQILGLVLTFAAHNPGITRVLLGDALVGEHERLRRRAAQFFDHIETRLRQVLRDRDLTSTTPAPVPASVAAALLMAVVEGRLTQYNRSGFSRSPIEGWEAQWPLLAASLLVGGRPRSADLDP